MAAHPPFPDLAALLVPLLAGGSGAQAALQTVREAEDLRTHYDVLAYHLELAVDPGARRIEGSVSVEARALQEGLTHLQLDLDRDLDVSRVTSAGVEIGFGHVNDMLVCQLPEPVDEGGEFEATVHYSGEPRAEDAFSGFHWAQTADGRPWINTSCQGPGAHSWWPCKSSYYHPEDKPESLRVDLTVPGDLYAVSNGRLAEVVQLDDGRRTYRWEHGYPLETYSVTLNVAPYVVVESELELPGLEEPVPWIYYVLPESAEKAAVQFAQMPELLRVFSEAFGPWPFPDSKVALVETNFWGMEHSTAVAYGSSYPAWCEQTGTADPYRGSNRYFDYILVHEVAHEWWGNAVSTTRWGDFWIHEGFGTYAEGVYVEKTQGREVADRFFQDQNRRLIRNKRSRLYRGDDLDSGQAYHSDVYFKGSLVLNTLRHYVDDDEAWWRTLRAFNQRFRYGNASTEDFRAVLEEETEREWQRFFDEWVYGVGHPELEGTVRVDGQRIHIEVENGSSADTGFEVPLDLRWEEDGLTWETRLWLEPGPFETALPYAAPPGGLEVVGLQRLLGRHEVEVKP